MARLDYDPYGQAHQTWHSGELDPLTYQPIQFDFLFTGHLHHGRSGLYFAPYRAYDPELGRWISRDPIDTHGGINLYEYVGGDPVNAVDPTGLLLINSSDDDVVVVDGQNTPTDTYLPPGRIYYGDNDGVWIYDWKCEKWTFFATPWPEDPLLHEWKVGNDGKVRTSRGKAMPPWDGNDWITSPEVRGGGRRGGVDPPTYRPGRNPVYHPHMPHPGRGIPPVDGVSCRSRMGQGPVGAGTPPPADADPPE